MKNESTHNLQKQDYEIRWPKLSIKYLVYSCKDFIVFIDNENDVDWETTDEYEIYLNKKLGHKNMGQFNNIINRATLIECTPCDHLKSRILINFKRMIGDAIARNLDLDYKNAEKILDGSVDYIRKRNIEESRRWILTSSGLTGILFGISGVILWLIRIYVIAEIGQTAFNIFISLSAGSLGALLSVIMRTGNIELDCSAGKTLHYIEGIFRIISGMISALIVDLAIISGYFLGPLYKAGDGIVSLILFGFIAGWSERFAPSIISSIVKIQNKNNDKPLTE